MAYAVRAADWVALAGYSEIIILIFLFSSLQYINRDLTEEFYTIDNHSDTLYKKVHNI